MSTTNVEAGAETDKRAVNIEDQTTFGEYLTNQYELLKRTLSYLAVDDLCRAGRVCRSWNRTASYIHKQRKLHSRFCWHLHCPQPSEHLHNYRDNITFKTQLVLGLQLKKSKKLDSFLEEISHFKYTPEGKKLVIPGSNGKIFLVDSNKLDIPICMANDVFKYTNCRNAALLFPESCRHQIVTSLVLEERDWNNIENQCLSSSAHGDLKGLLVFNPYHAHYALTIFYDKLMKNLTTPVAFAGGVFPKVKYFDNGQWCSGGLLVLAFFGTVECYSDILYDMKLPKIESFMKKMKSNLGSFDAKKQQRIAFVIRCEGRRCARQENEMYQKYFPGIPAFVLDSFGEYGTTADSSKKGDPLKRFRSDINITHAYCTMYFIITTNLH